MTIYDDIKMTEKALELNNAKLNDYYAKVDGLNQRIKNIAFTLQHHSKSFDSDCASMAEVITERAELLEEIAFLERDNAIMQSDLYDMYQGIK